LAEQALTTSVAPILKKISGITVHHYCAIQVHKTMSTQSGTANPLVAVRVE